MNVRGGNTILRAPGLPKNYSFFMLKKKKKKNVISGLNDLFPYF